ncbi:hypothetical protein RUMHYD_02325 [Blautia hydrogenotrophica DSM 10507]|uniref:Uncharacterized protein n=1 Tax=Blautia hydrogenotrophica (strain DSM 10507 / JCM 14656 / S5a33) TaxID=476272 RepID=C0CN87_BLAHS|nr:hypothetical protein RUMHYD_02325 [Blautia hydrogenotrophica DSM 10507]
MVLPFFHIAVNLRLYKSLSSVIYYSVKVIVQNRQKGKFNWRSHPMKFTYSFHKMKWKIGGV